MEKLPHQTLKLPNRQTQSGAVLIVSLVILTVLTIIAVGTATDIGLQSNMVRNNQISLQAYNLSLSELRSQYQAVNTPNYRLSDGSKYLAFLAQARETSEALTLAPEDLIMPDNAGAFTQSASVSFVGDTNNCADGEAFAPDGGSGSGSQLIFEINSVSRLENTGINSNQSFGLCYPNPESS